MQGIQLLMQEQKAMAQGGVGIVQPQNFYNAAAKLAEVVGFKSADQFFSQPQQQQGLPPEVQQQMQQMQQAMQELQQENQALKSGVEVKRIEVESRERIEGAKQQNALSIEAMRDDQKRDSDEMKAWLALTVKRMEEAQAAIAAMQSTAEMATAPENKPEAAEPAQGGPDMAVVLAEALSRISAPRKRKVTIQAPSGQVYQGGIEDDDGEPQ
jgi:predicted nuclease with TOPRIM domain